MWIGQRSITCLQMMSISDDLVSARYQHYFGRHPQYARCLRRADRFDRARSLCTSIIVAAELRFGAAKKGSAALSERVSEALAGLRVLPLDGDADVRYGSLRAALESSGRVIGANDMLIAAHALSLDAVLVTDNIEEFARVKGLRCENWLNPI